ncbi:MAG: hypothetical protein H0W81_08705 [Chloroflexi bacterium]|nr:hypothetical protein [Chloroflexota bacterium]
MKKKDRDLPHSAAELLADWRGAKRDTAAANVAAEVATLALEAARASDEAALETEAAANAAAEAVKQALAAAASARRAAAHAAQAAQMLLASAEGDKVRAIEDVGEAKRAETAAGDRFHEAQEGGFPRDHD